MRKSSAAALLARAGKKELDANVNSELARFDAPGAQALEEGFGELIGQHLTDSRHMNNTQFPFADLLRRSAYSRLAGYEDVNDAARLVKHARYHWLLLGDSHLTRRLFTAIVQGIDLLPLPAR